ncbi:MAG: hypothetical protein K1060chlam2_00381 [Chlamydiae bacterium]|nr:hypothetical protein [Chlamydiota bacterium]
MKKAIGLGATLLLFLILVQFAQLPAKSDELTYRRYREEFAHNLKNPHIERYRELSFDLAAESPSEKSKTKETM